MCAPLTFAKCCSIFSVTGIVFLTVIGFLFQSQPMYIKGPEDAEKAAQGCYGGAGIYAVTMVLSIIYWYRNEPEKPNTPTSTTSPSGYSAVGS